MPAARAWHAGRAKSASMAKARERRLGPGSNPSAVVSAKGGAQVDRPKAPIHQGETGLPPQVDFCWKLIWSCDRLQTVVGRTAQEPNMIRRPGDRSPEPPGGRAAERLRMFEQARLP